MKPKLMGETWRKYPTETSKQKTTYGLFQCQYCGEEFETNIQSVKSDDTKSCGCLRGELHGLKEHKLYGTWRQMVQRCTNSKHKNYKNYGGRGIIVCEEWLNIRNFVDWCDLTHPNQEGYTLDRINNDKGYSPENCTWSDRTTQVLNRRIMKNNKSGYVGIYWNKASKRWVVNIKISKKLINLGSFKDKIEAVQVRDNYII